MFLFRLLRIFVRYEPGDLALVKLQKTWQKAAILLVGLLIQSFCLGLYFRVISGLGESSRSIGVSPWACVVVIVLVSFVAHLACGFLDNMTMCVQLVVARRKRDYSARYSCRGLALQTGALHRVLGRMEAMETLRRWRQIVEEMQVCATLCCNASP